MERVNSLADLKHPIIREALKLVHPGSTCLALTSMADIPAGTGLGSSGSFTTALLKALHAFHKNLVDPQELAEQACHIEIDRLREPVGKQDQYIAALGGVTCLRFLRDGRVEAQPLNVSEETLNNLEDSLVLFFTGFSRQASQILKEQDDKTKSEDDSMLGNLHYVKEMGIRSKEAIEAGRLHDFGEILHEHWSHKKGRSKDMSNPQIDEWYELALNNGAVGGKLIGAGGGGFRMFYTRDKIRLRSALLKAGLREVRFRFDLEGAKVTVQ